MAVWVPTRFLKTWQQHNDKTRLKFCSILSVEYSEISRITWNIFLLSLHTTSISCEYLNTTHQHSKLLKSGALILLLRPRNPQGTRRDECKTARNCTGLHIFFHQAEQLNPWKRKNRCKLSSNRRQETWDIESFTQWSIMKWILFSRWLQVEWCEQWFLFTKERPFRAFLPLRRILWWFRLQTRRLVSTTALLAFEVVTPFALR